MSAEPGNYESSWKTVDPVGLTRESFLDLLYGRTPLIKESQFLSLEQSKRLQYFLEPLFSPYLHATGPPVEKVGLAQFEFQAQSQDDFKNRQGNEKQRYFEECARIRSLHDDVAQAVGGENVWAKIVSRIAALVPEWDVGLASEGHGHEYFSGVFRKINHGVPIHCDWCPYDCLTEDWILSRISHQAVFNLYITQPAAGGETTVFDVQWSPEALRFRDPLTYGYAEELVRGRKKAPFSPEVGDLYLFNSGNMHTAAPIVGGGESVGRLAMASFMGLLPSDVTGGKPRLMFWS